MTTINAIEVAGEASLQALHTGDDRSEVSYAPFLVAAGIASLLMLVGQIVFTILVANQYGAPVALAARENFPVLLAIEVGDRLTFSSIIEWATSFTCMVLAVYGFSSFMDSHSTQVRLGRATAWVQIFVLGAVQIVWSPLHGTALAPMSWTYYPLWVGIVGLIASLGLIFEDLPFDWRRRAAKPTRRGS